MHNISRIQPLFRILRASKLSIHKFTVYTLAFLILGYGLIPLQAFGETEVWSTYLGGSELDEGWAIGSDSSGNVYAGGFTYSSDFPIVGGGSTYRGDYDAFIGKFNGSGSLLWSTYLGGSNYDNCVSLTIDATGSPCFIGRTGSSNFPTAGAL